MLLLCPTQSASIDRGIGGELSCLCHSSSASVQYSARSIEYYSPTPVLYNVSIVQPAVFIPILSNIQPLTILSTIQQLFPTKNSFILHSSQANKTPKKQFARRILRFLVQQNTALFSTFLLRSSVRHRRDISTFLDILTVYTMKTIYFLNAYHLGW